MLLIKAEQRYSRQSPYKVREVADVIRKLSLPSAVEQLSLMDKKGAIVLLKVINQAVANAKNNLGLSPADLVFHEVLVNSGPQYKRFRPVSRGRGHGIIKRTCHVRIVLKAKDVDEAKVKATQEKVKKAEAKKAEVVTVSADDVIEPAKAEVKKDIKAPRIKAEKVTTGKVEVRKVTNRTTSK